MNYWLLVDTHLGHREMHDYCGRPEGFEQLILARTKQVAQPGDVIIHLGDFCIRRDEYWHALFFSVLPPGVRRWFVPGNHDRRSKSWYLRNGWDFVAEEITLEVYGKRIVLSHRPIADRDDFDLSIHGHLHNPPHHDHVPTVKQRLIYMEHEYTPLSLRKVVENWRQK